MPTRDILILPSTKIGELLDRYPELEAVLIGMAAPFKKLKNPLLRKSIGRVASLQHVAAIGGMPVGALVNRLRAAVGQPNVALENADDVTPAFSPQPEWFDPARIVSSIDERQSDPDEMPLVAVLRKVATLQPTEILELVTAFLPAPGIDIMRAKGLLVWTVREKPELIRTYISKPGPCKMVKDWRNK